MSKNTFNFQEFKEFTLSLGSIFAKVLLCNFFLSFFIPLYHHNNCSLNKFYQFIILSFEMNMTGFIIAISFSSISFLSLNYFSNSNNVENELIDEKHDSKHDEQ